MRVRGLSCCRPAKMDGRRIMPQATKVVAGVYSRRRKNLWMRAVRFAAVSSRCLTARCATNSATSREAKLCVHFEQCLTAVCKCMPKWICSFKQCHMKQLNNTHPKKNRWHSNWIAMALRHHSKQTLDCVTSTLSRIVLGRDISIRCWKFPTKFYWNSNNDRYQSGRASQHSVALHHFPIRSSIPLR